MSALRALLAGVIDYAALFPPTSADMPRAVRDYASYRAGQESWMLGRFVLSVDRLHEFVDTYMMLDERSRAGGWRLSTLLGDDAEAGLARVGDFNRTNHDIVIDAIEARLTTPAAIARAMHAVGRLPGSAASRAALFVEVPASGDPASIISAICEWGVNAKIRTGGTSAELIPSKAYVVQFLRECADANVPFKATAGLHHPLCGEYRLTYEPDSARAKMFGFLNVFLAASFMRIGLDDADIAAVLEESDPRAFAADANAVRWRDRSLSVDQITDARKFALCFGSCSFRDPVDELAALGFRP